ncbi:hypothetical protein ACFTZI_01100 [Streptomyces decoyicus]|uniref:hypothetical protein n=1 Tax=Streptomyces decoyicus TaxID=249567 RepID=UPI00362E71E0
MATVGYGYSPWLAGMWLIALSLLGTLVFGAHDPTLVKPGEGGPCRPFVYTLDLLIPIGGLGQRTGWYWTDSGTQWLAYVRIAAVLSPWSHCDDYARCKAIRGHGG